MSGRTRSTRVALVTATEARAVDDDLPPLLDAFAAVGAEAEPVDWDDDAVDWRRFDLALVRSTWDYHQRYGEFLTWAERAAAATCLQNPLEVLRWNTDKRYLDDLARAGIPTVPTTWLDPAATGAPPELPDGGEVVVKPSVSAGSRDTGRFVLDDADERAAAEGLLLDILAAGKVAMVQPYLDSVDRRGETAVIVVDGTVSHGVRKGPILVPGGDVTTNLFAAEDLSPREPDAAELAVTAAVLDHLRARFGRVPLYARVDLVTGADGDPVLLELELTEPSLFFELAPGSGERFVEAALARAPRG